MSGRQAKPEPLMRAPFRLSAETAAWLEARAEALDRGELGGPPVLARLAEAQVFGLGVAPEWGGAPGTDIGHAIEAIADLARHSLTAAFLAWGQRVVIETLLRSGNVPLARRWVPDLMAARLAGASGLSNVIKSLGGFDRLRIQAREGAGGWRLDGRIDWITNAQPDAFVATAATALPQGGVALVALHHGLPGLQRSADLPLLGLRGSATAQIDLQDVRVAEDQVLQADARQILPGLRPRLVGLQCGLSLGLARAALDVAQRAGLPGKGLQPLCDKLNERLEGSASALINGVRQDMFVSHPAALFRLRIALAEIAQQAVELELQATGGAAYLMAPHGGGFARRWREAAFLPIVTPSLVQLRAELAKLEAAAQG
ncbi:acyl-CoA dehydrogenase [Bordetella trematum]|nr:acyl-CoA dehydrogenase [Bordetella trematum]